MISKSQFRLGLSCPNKIYFKNNKAYHNASVDDPFLEALASGGFQIEEYARRHYPEGEFIEADYTEREKAIALTQEALQRDGVFFEAAFAADGLFALTDIVEKRGNVLKMIEVKSKSFDPEERDFLNKSGNQCLSGWKDYLFDLAFQTEVASRNYPDFQIESYLFLVDKTKSATVTGLSQMIRLPKKGGDVRKDVAVAFDNLNETGVSLMHLEEMTDIVEGIRAENIAYSSIQKRGFQQLIKDFTKIYTERSYPNYPTEPSVCKKCEFKTKSLIDEPGKKSGFAKCFKQQHGLVDSDFSKTFSFSLHAGRVPSSAPVFMEQLSVDDVKVESVIPERMEQKHRRWVQLNKEVEKDTSPFLMKDELREEFASHVYPLHFIDFESGLGPLPPLKGIRPYQHIPFQFSHHILHSDGRVEHKTQVILADVGQFPNYDFVRELKKSVGTTGTIFRYHNYENTVLKMVRDQLSNSTEPDKVELIEFINSITRDSKPTRKGERDMVDLQKIIYAFYYDPITKGGNSIKDYLPALLNSSKFLQDKYSQPIKNIAVSSINDADGNRVWVEFENGTVKDPYKNLAPIFPEGKSTDDFSGLVDLDDVKNGGAALVAYAYLQYVDISEDERKAIIQALYRYCELDTLAMVMIYEGLREMCN